MVLSPAETNLAGALAAGLEAAATGAAAAVLFRFGK